MFRQVRGNANLVSQLRRMYSSDKPSGSSGEPGSGAGKGGGGGGTVREAGGSMGKRGAVQEEQYFHRKEQEKLDKLKDNEQKKPPSSSD